MDAVIESEGSMPVISEMLGSGAWLLSKPEPLSADSCPWLGQALSTQCGIGFIGCSAPGVGGHLCLRGVLCQPHATSYQPTL